MLELLQGEDHLGKYALHKDNLYENFYKFHIYLHYRCIYLLILFYCYVHLFELFKAKVHLDDKKYMFFIAFRVIDLWIITLIVYILRK